jgi:hypothetical protein
MIQRASCEFKTTIRLCAQTVRWSNLAAFAAADHAPL